MHRFTAQEFAHRGAQHRATIGGTGVGGKSRTLQLQFPALAARVDRFTERDRAPVTELTRPVAELMTTVIRRIGLHPVEQRVAAKHLGKPLRGNFTFVDTEQRGDLARMRQQAWRRDRGRLHEREEGALYLALAQALFRVAGKIAHKPVVESEIVHGTSITIRQCQLSDACGTRQLMSFRSLAAMLPARLSDMVRQIDKAPGDQGSLGRSPIR